MKNYKIFFRSINFIYALKDCFNCLVIENKALYKNLAFNYEEELIISNNDELFLFDKNVLLLQNIFYINLNENKMLKELCRRIEHLVKTKYEVEYSNINTNIANLMNAISLDLDNKIEYNDLIDVQKLLSNLSLKFQQIESDNYLLILLEFLKLCSDILGIKVVLSFGLSNILSKEEQVILNKELIGIGVNIIDIIYNEKGSQECELLRIDQDYCII